ncbi:tRNA pseudouridine(38-40) synthase TruA, partial [Fibrobacterota bacterium]
HYQYTISCFPTALHFPLVWITQNPLDSKLFAGELRDITGRHDFSCFSIPRHDGRTTECMVSRAELEVRKSRFQIHLEANRFLHKMVRSIVGACYDVARKNRSPGLIKSIFSNEFDGEHTWAPSCGLCLKKVSYPDYEF